MQYSIRHTTTYRYDRPVTLSPHTVRLRPRCDVTQTLQNFMLEADPHPIQVLETVDLDGNDLITLHFSDHSLQELHLTTSFDITTWRSNPFDYLLDPWANRLPMNYPTTLLHRLQPYLGGWGCNFPTLDPVAVELSRDIWQETAGNPILFLWTLNQRICDSCKHIIRETGDPFPPSVTWKTKEASCRDMAVLFIEACRAVGLAARFVSGYQEGDPDWEHRHLHAWAEVYLPGGGWRGYDPTQGLAVGDRHITLVTASNSQDTAPITGFLKTGIGATSEMSYKLLITPISEAE